MTTFSGGAALEAKLSELAEKLGDGKTLRVGFLEGRHTLMDNLSQWLPQPTNMATLQ